MDVLYCCETFDTDVTLGKYVYAIEITYTTKQIYFYLKQPFKDNLFNSKDFNGLETT